jgi:RNA-directed DNA polymerase
MIKAPVELQDLRRKIYIKAKAEKDRRHLMKARKRKGFGWDRWSRSKLYELGLYKDYQIRYYSPLKASPTR